MGIYEKNNEMLLEVISQLPREAMQDWKFYFVGPMTDSFSKFVEEFFLQHQGLKENIVFTGSITNRQKLYEIYAKSKIYCLTSRSEGFNISVLEAMYCGCYPVLTNYGVSAYDVTDNGRIGEICEQGNVSDFVKKLESVMISSARNDVLSQKEREWARSKYGYKAIVEKLDGYISDLK